MKAQILISHVFIITLTVLLVTAMIYTLNHLRSEYQNFLVQYESRQICFSIKNGIEKIYWPGFSSQNNETMGILKINLPKRVANAKYHVYFNDSFLYINVSDLRYSHACKIGFNLTYNGSSDGGLTEITWLREGRGRDIITMMSV